MAVLTSRKAHSIAPNRGLVGPQCPAEFSGGKNILAPATSRNMSFVHSARSLISIPTAHPRFNNKEELRSTNTYLTATEILHVLKKRTKSFGVLLKFLKALGASASTITYPQTGNTQIQMIWDKTWKNYSLMKNTSRNISVPIKLTVDEK